MSVLLHIQNPAYQVTKRAFAHGKLRGAASASGIQCREGAGGRETGPHRTTGDRAAKGSTGEGLRFSGRPSTATTDNTLRVAPDPRRISRFRIPGSPDCETYSRSARQ